MINSKHPYCKYVIFEIMTQNCGYCGFFGEMVFVHSHYQCPRCKINIAPCCEGENCQEITKNEGILPPNQHTITESLDFD
jgi:hypothetical protein